jgi:hypothetical protein
LAENGLEPIINACKQNQTENVRFIASFDDKQMRIALNYLEKHPKDLTEEMIQLLEGLV